MVENLGFVEIFGIEPNFSNCKSGVLPNKLYPQYEIMKTILKNCIHCNGEFAAPLKEHKRGNAKYCSKECFNIYSSITKKKEKIPNVKCNRCAAPIYRKQFLVINHKLFYCSENCRYPITDKLIKKVSRSKPRLKFAHGPYSKVFFKKCIYTGRMFCAKSGTVKAHPDMAETLLHYRSLCKFKFSVKSYPDWFDLSKITEHGWYSASNRGGNVNGISRDHRVSVKYGFNNNIDPKIISHPANCQLMTHPENFKKLDSCSCTLEQLLLDIERFNAQYPSNV